MDWYVKLIRRIFPSNQIPDAIRSLVVMSILVAAVLGIIGIPTSIATLQMFAAWLTAAGVLLLAYADARAIGTVRLKSEAPKSSAVSSAGNPAGTWPRLMGHGCLVPGALILLLTM